MPSFWRSNRVRDSKSHSFFPDRQQQQQPQHPGEFHSKPHFHLHQSRFISSPPTNPSAARASPAVSSPALHFTALKPKLIRPAAHKISLRIFRAVVRLLSSELPPLARPRSRVRAAITACQHRTPADLHCPSRPPLYRRIPRTSIALVQRHLDH